jgi:BASS family bile acid:Na+ symporter
MAAWVIGLSLKIVVFLLMLFVGLDCTMAGMRDSLRRPGLLLLATGAQFLVIPLLAGVLCHVLPLLPEVRGAILLTACASSGAISNTYTFIGRGNSAFSVTLTVWSTLLSFVGTPLALWVLQRTTSADVAQTLSIPLVPVFQQLLLLLVLPVAVGLLIRNRLESRVVPWLPRFRALSTALVVAFIALVEVSTPKSVFAMVVPLLLPALALTLILAGAGLLLGFLFRRPRTDIVALAYEWPCRNLAIVALIGLTIMQRPALVLFATAFFIAQAMMLLVPAVLLGRFTPDSADGPKRPLSASGQ